MARVLARIRLSRLTDESTSEDRQRAMIIKWAEREGHTIVGWAIDMDVSGAVSPFKAPELSEWLSYRAHEWDMIVAWKLDRIGRTLFNLNDLFRWVLDNNKTIYCIEDNIDLSSLTGRLIAMVIAVIAEGELEAIKSRTRASQAELRRLGRWHGGHCPYGYSPEKLDGGGYRLRINPDQQAIVSEMLQLVRDGESTYMVAKKFNDRGVPSPRGKQWTSQQIVKMARSRYVVGQDIHNGEVVLDNDGLPLQVAEPLVPITLWREVNTILNSRAKTRQRPNARGLLLNIAVCDQCDSNLYLAVQRAGNREYRYWRCSGRYSYNNGCGQLGANADVLEEHVHNVMRQNTAPRMEEVLIPGDDRSDELEQVTESIGRLVKLIETGVSAPEMDESLARLVARRAELEASPISHARRELRPVHPPETYGEAWQRMTDADRRGLLLSHGVRAYVRDRRIVRLVTPRSWLREEAQTA